MPYTFSLPLSLSDYTPFSIEERLSNGILSQKSNHSISTESNDSCFFTIKEPETFDTNKNYTSPVEKISQETTEDEDASWSEIFAWFDEPTCSGESPVGEKSSLITEVEIFSAQSSATALDNCEPQGEWEVRFTFYNSEFLNNTFFLRKDDDRNQSDPLGKRLDACNGRKLRKEYYSCSYVISNKIKGELVQHLNNNCEKMQVFDSTNQGSLHSTTVFRRNSLISDVEELSSVLKKFEFTNQEIEFLTKLKDEKVFPKNKDGINAKRKAPLESKSNNSLLIKSENQDSWTVKDNSSSDEETCPYISISRKMAAWYEKKRTLSFDERDYHSRLCDIEIFI